MEANFGWGRGRIGLRLVMCGSLGGRIRFCETQNSRGAQEFHITDDSLSSKICILRNSSTKTLRFTPVNFQCTKKKKKEWMQAKFERWYFSSNLFLKCFFSSSLFLVNVKDKDCNICETTLEMFSFVAYPLEDRFSNWNV